MIIIREEEVRFAETDMLGVVHHANYFRWFEVGRVAFLAEIGIILLELMDEGVLFPVKAVSCNYILPAKFGDEVIIETSLSKLSKAQMNFKQKIINKKTQDLLATGEVQVVFTNVNGKIIRIPMEHYQKLERVYE